MNWAIASAKSWMRNVIVLTKPGIVFSSVLTAAVGIWLAPAPILFWVSLATLVGTGLSVGGACALNMYLERHVDAQMPRTRHRPLPAGRLSPATALWVSVLLGVSGIALLGWFVNAITAWLCVLAYLCYTLLYTPLKKHTSLAFVLGTVPGAIPALMGWTSVIPAISVPSLSLFIVMLFWQLVHSLALAMGLEHQYAQASIPTFTSRFGMKATRVAVVISTLGLVASSLLPMIWNRLGWWYGAPVLLLNGWLLGSCLSWLQSQQPIQQARRFFLHTLIYLVLLLVALMVGATL